MSRTHNSSIGNILEFARRRPDTTHVAGPWMWNKLEHKMKQIENDLEQSHL